MSQVRVLVVDDQEPFRRALGAVVEETDGFVVVGSVASGEESITAAAALRPHLVLMDIHLPGIDGIEASRRLTSGTDGERPVVVLLSTYDEDQFDLSGSGATAYVAKAALDPDRLLEIWQQH